MLNRGEEALLEFGYATLLVLSGNLQGLEKNFNDLLCPVLKGFVMGKARYPRYFEDFQFSDEKDASKMLNEIMSRIADEKLPLLYILIDEYDNFTNQLLTSFNDTLYEKVTTGDSFLRTFFKVIKGGIGEGAIRTCFCTGVLPVTMDDLTSGCYNIAEVLTLEPEFVSMLGFDHEEASEYLRYVMCVPNETMQTIARYVLQGLGSGQMMPLQE